jgi:apolipoprotein D and lipocalin family protein
VIALLATILTMMPGGPQHFGPVRTVAAVDLDRYVGEWYEVSRFPNTFQRSCAGDVRATYSRRPDGRVDVVNRCRTADGGITKAQGIARIVDAGTSAKLKVRFAPAFLSFLPFVWGDYWIVGLADDYSWAVVGSPNRAYLWILARTPALDTGRYAAALSAARANHFDVSRLVMTSQRATDVRTPR